MQDVARSPEVAALLRNLGGFVLRRRKALKWTRRDLAAHTSISERFLADVEAGRANPSVSKLFALARALGCAPGDLLEVAAGPRGVALLGLRGAGKSTVGAALAESLGCAFVELDHLIEATTGLTLDEMFQVHGESYYRRAEHEALREALRRPQPVVIACGGGIVTSDESFGLLQAKAHTVWLRARPEDHWRRVVAQGDTRPMADNDQAFADLCSILREREALYRKAELCVDTSRHDCAGSVSLIGDFLKSRTPR